MMESICELQWGKQCLMSLLLAISLFFSGRPFSSDVSSCRTAGVQIITVFFKSSIIALIGAAHTSDMGPENSNVFNGMNTLPSACTLSWFNSAVCMPIPGMLCHTSVFKIAF